MKFIKDFALFGWLMMKDVWASRYGSLFLCLWLVCIGALLGFKASFFQTHRLLYALVCSALQWSLWGALYSGYWYRVSQRDIRLREAALQAAREAMGVVEETLQKYGFEKGEEIMPVQRWKQ